MKKLCIAAILAFSTVTVASAQDVTSIRVTIFRQGSTSPAVAPMSWPISQFQCGLTATPAPPGTIDNPTEFRVPDPTNQNLDCRLSNPDVNALLGQIGYDPVNVYFGRSAYTNSVGTGPESPDSNPFRQPGTTPTVAPASLRWGRGQ